MSRATDKITADAMISCHLDSDQITQRLAEVSDLLRQATELRECDDGYLIDFPGDATASRRLLEFIIAERECCPFLSFDLTFQPDHGQIGVRIAGSEEIKALIRTLSISLGVEP